MAQDRAERLADEKKLHAPGTPTRLQVIPEGPTLHEYINGQLTPIPAGKVFLHPAPARAKQLLDIRPQLVRETDLPTDAEALAAKDEEDVAIAMVADELRGKAAKVVKERKDKLDKLEKVLRNMTPEVLDAEVEKRGVKPVNGSADAKVAAILADEAEAMKA